MKYIKVLTIKFTCPISQYEVPLFRGAILDLIKDREDIVLFHNHTETGLRYAYPLIQYKRINGKAAIVCIGEGTEVIGEFFATMQPTIMLGNREVSLTIESFIPTQMDIQIWTDEFNYYIYKWLPLNQDNFQKYRDTESVVDKCRMIEEILTANILSMAKGLDVYLDKQVEVKITKIVSIFPLTYKGIRMLSFDVEFKTNVSIPNNIGLGKGVSLGFGTIHKKQIEKN